MAIPRCPGQDMRFWKPGDIFDVACPGCGQAVEFWKDEPFRLCPGCGGEVRNPRIDLGCARWCRYAAECVGPPAAGEAVQPLPDRLMSAAGRFFGDDPARLARAVRAMEHARRIAAGEGGSPLVAQAAALLYEAAAGLRQPDCRPDDPDSPCPVKPVLERVGLEPEAIDQICRVVRAIRDGQTLDSPEFRVAADAVELAAMECGAMRADAGKLRTAAGRRLAVEPPGSRREDLSPADHRPLATDHSMKENP